MKTMQSFLSEYSLLALKKVEPNFFQIAGFPHYENVSSNVLQFFLSNNLVVKSLLDCMGLEYNPAHDFVVYIKREAATEDNKRIDILISTNKYIIGIENKVNAGLNNPVGEYGSFLKNLAKKEGKEPVFFVLSKKAVEANPEYKNILHRNFSQEVKKHYPELLNDFGYRHFLFLTEYITNMDSFEGVYCMNNEFIEIAKRDGNLEKIEQIMSEGERLRNDLLKLTAQILDDLRGNKSFKTTWVHREPGEFSGTAVFQDCFLTEGNYNATIDVKVTVSGFEVYIFERKDTSDENFKNVLHTILPNLYTDYVVSDKARYKYKDTINLDEYDKLLSMLREILASFDKYIANKV
jgi:hypothetical protein